MMRAFTILILFFLVKDIAASWPADRCRAMKPMSIPEAHITNRLYMNEDVIWGRPKGILYGNLPGAADEQKAVLFPDGSCSYIVANITIPTGGSLTLKGTYPHVRYFSLTVPNQLEADRMGNGAFYRGSDIVPDAGSYNPFLPSTGRNVVDRSYTMHIVPGNAPEGDAPVNTIFIGNATKDDRIRVTMRHYLADQGYDGMGHNYSSGKGDGLPKVTLNMPNGDEFEGPELVEILQSSKGADINGYPVETWLENVKNAIDPTNAPMVKDPSNGFQVFWNIDYSVTGLFVSTESSEYNRVAQHPPSNEGGYSTNPDTRYLLLGFSFGWNEVLVIQGKMPTHPHTRLNNNILPVDPQVQYFSINTAGVGCSGEGWMTVFDEGIPVDENGDYTVVVSWPWNRPTNAIPENGVQWLDVGVGGGHYIGARNWVGTAYIRFQGISPNWTQSPQHIPMPTLADPTPHDAEVMGPYYPRASYTSKHEFESRGGIGKCVFS